MAYTFYIQKYKQGTTSFAKDNIETKYGCRYRMFKNVSGCGDVSNVYTEEYAEASGARTFIPASGDLAFKPYDCTLTILFKGADCQKNFKAFTDYVMGQKVEYSDNFRNIFATLLMTKRPTVNQSRLYGGSQYIDADFTFTNVLGRTFTSTQIK